MAGSYRPLNNGYLDDRWSAILSGLSGPVFPRGKQGLRGLLRYLRSGGTVVMLPDQFVIDGALLEFLGQPAPTSLAAAELAQRFDVPLIPFYGIRRGNGFDTVLEAPIPTGSPEIMMQAVNDSLAARIAADPGAVAVDASAMEARAGTTRRCPCCCRSLIRLFEPRRRQDRPVACFLHDHHMGL